MNRKLRSVATGWLPLLVPLMLGLSAAGCGFEGGTPATDPGTTPGTNSSPPTSSGGSSSGSGATDTSDLFLVDEPCLDARGPTTFNHNEMFQLVNEYRRSRGLNALIYSRVLQRAADDYAFRMYQEDFFDHIAPDGSQASERVMDAGFCHPYVGENLAYGLNQLAGAAEAIQGLQTSPGHNANMLHAAWDYMGVGFFTVSGVQGQEYWWVQLFAQDLPPDHSGRLTDLRVKTVAAGTEATAVGSAAGYAAEESQQRNNSVAADLFGM